MTFQTGEPLHALAINVSARTWGDLIHQVEANSISYEVPYQRGDVWTPRQRIMLIHSVLTGTPIPLLILNYRPMSMWTGPDGKVDQPCYAVIDGKQRLITVQMWMHGLLPVPASWFPAEDVLASIGTSDGPYVHYPMLARRQGRFFENRAIPVGEARVGSVAEEAAIYLRVNGSGTPQSDEDIERAMREAGKPA